jgi:hypothetical protein
MPKMSMVIQNSNIPRISIRGTYNTQVNQGFRPQMTIGLGAPMIQRIAGAKSGCGACGK